MPTNLCFNAKKLTQSHERPLCNSNKIIAEKISILSNSHYLVSFLQYHVMNQLQSLISRKLLPLTSFNRKTTTSWDVFAMQSLSIAFAMRSSPGSLYTTPAPPILLHVNFSHCSSQKWTINVNCKDSYRLNACVVWEQNL